MHSDIQGGEVAAGAVAPALFVSPGARCWSDAPDRRLAHPYAERLSPLFFVLGAALPEDRVIPRIRGFSSRGLVHAQLRAARLRRLSFVPPAGDTP
ncbi:hypothetical protein [Cystobacter fuscus]|uniref:hypothetical protein n=1 Tax=Cystobacter fuscus TaxID=43 RepID=UPI0037BE7F1E